jgi:hypothetical protein
MEAPTVDSLGYFPLGELLEARFIVLAQPFQHHLAPESQRLVRAVYDAFLDHREVGRDFTEYPALYDLELCTGYIYERRRPTSRATALATLDMMMRAIPKRPGMQPDWSVVDHLFPSWLVRNADGSARWTAHPAIRSREPWTTLATIDPPADRSEISGVVEFVDGRCAGATITLSAEGPNGGLETLDEVRRRPTDGAAFRLQAEARHEGRLFLSLFPYSDASSIDYCLLTLDPLTIRGAVR